MIERTRIQRKKASAGDHTTQQNAPAALASQNRSATPAPVAAVDPRYGHDYGQVRVRPESQTDVEKTLPSDKPPIVVARVAQLDDKAIDKTPFEERALMLERLCDGEPDEAVKLTILRIVRESKQDEELVKLLDKAEADTLVRTLDGDHVKKLRQMLRERYYKRTEPKHALALVRRCLDGDRDEQVAEMLTDLLISRSDGRLLIEEIGRTYGSGPAEGFDRDFKNGLYKIENGIEGAQRARLQPYFGTSDL